jgi:hypothetical protein
VTLVYSDTARECSANVLCCVGPDSMPERYRRGDGPWVEETYRCPE